MKDTIISLKDITVSYDGEQVLGGFNLEIHDGEFVTLLGPSGCGKTTVLRTIAGFIRPDAGDVFFNDKNITDLPPHKREVNTIFQKYALFPHLNVYENIAFGMRLKGRGEKEIKGTVQEMLAMVNLTGYAHRGVGQLSGGQQQRVAIARAIVTEPEVIFFDEPTSALDPELVGEVLNVMRNLAAEGMTMLIVTHEMQFARNVASHVVFMDQGLVVEEGGPEEIFESPREARTRQFLQFIMDREAPAPQ